MGYRPKGTPAREHDNYTCGTYKQKKGLCTAHYIRVTVLEALVLENIQDERFAKLSVDYEQEQAELKNSIADLRQTVEQGHQQEDNTKQFLKLVKSYTIPDKLTPAMLHALMDKIVVYAPDKSSGHHRQQIDIHYNFVGQFDLSHETATRQTVKETA